MNAYELAKYLEDDFHIQEGVIDMLRQQADRIAELEKECSEWEKAYNWMEIARNAPEKVSSKPVAWKYSVNDAHLMFSISEPPDDAYDEGTLIPLYTYPHSAKSVKVKQLSDEEIYELWIDAKQTALNTKGGIVELCFARAIIKEITE